MFRILSVQSKEEQERLAAECGALYHPRCPAYALYLGERFSGLCQFMIGAGLGEIVTLDAIPGFAGDADGDAEQYLAALCRTALSFLEQIGLSRALYTGGEKSRRLMRPLLAKEMHYQIPLCCPRGVFLFRRLPNEP